MIRNQLKPLMVFFIFTLLKLNSVLAQESILSEVSYLYMEKLVATAKANYPRVGSLGNQINVAKSDLSGARLSWLEPLSFQYVARSNQATSNTVVDLQTADLLTGYQFGIAINPGSLLTKPSQIKKAKEQLKIAQSNQAEYYLQLEAQVKSRYVTLLQFQKSLAPINDMYITAQSNFENMKIKYQKAEITFAEYNSASNSLSNALQAKLQMEASYLNAKISLEELTVKKLEEIK
ncbi:TolC family protein [Pedobacter sp. KBS0701]|uniref:TolC family protein n=1 Tax=unclassified Pedobacter TaxID=2628915 RepID=UPI00110EB8FB|nr:TolC family protein [Pedobacter sp. KBS0701]QDW26966.1 TolC family protein [Pedobacter sp. KBS0701]